MSTTSKTTHPAFIQAKDMMKAFTKLDTQIVKSAEGDPQFPSFAYHHALVSDENISLADKRQYAAVIQAYIRTFVSSSDDEMAHTSNCEINGVKFYDLLEELSGHPTILREEAKAEDAARNERMLADLPMFSGIKITTTPKDERTGDEMTTEMYERAVAEFLFEAAQEEGTAIGSTDWATMDDYLRNRDVFEVEEAEGFARAFQWTWEKNQGEVGFSMPASGLVSTVEALTGRKTNWGFES